MKKPKPLLKEHSLASKLDFEIPFGFRQARLVDLTRLDRPRWHVGKETQLLLAKIDLEEDSQKDRADAWCYPDYVST